MDSFLGRLPHTTTGWIGPIVEVLLISAAFYVVIGFIRGTRGAGVARGLAVLSVAAFLLALSAARWLALENVVWLLERLVSVSMVGLVVIFQPEIRNGLVRLGQTIHVWVPTRTGIDKEITDAALAIAKQGAPGALIVVERNTRIGAYIESGVPIDAQLTSQLLRTIFTKNSPLHDGAAIIRGDRLVAANCLLPLSENVEVCRGMGTRHRAAIGLSEESDAVTVVVSEETRQVSVTMGGKIFRDLDYERLRNLLHENCLAVETAPSSDTVFREGA